MLTDSWVALRGATFEKDSALPFPQTPMYGLKNIKAWRNHPHPNMTVRLVSS